MGDEGSAPQNVFSGKWKLKEQENFEDFLCANGVNWMIRKAAMLSSPEMEITHEGNKFHIVLKSAMMAKEWKLTIGEEIEDKQKSGAVFLLMPTFEDGKLICEMTPKIEGTGKKQTHIREINGDELTLTLKVDDVTAKRIFTRMK